MVSIGKVVRAKQFRSLFVVLLLSGIAFGVVHGAFPPVLAESGSVKGGSNQVTDPGFEGGYPSLAWLEYANPTNPIVCDDHTCGGNPDFTGPRKGEWYLWLGGKKGEQFRSAAAQFVTIPEGGQATLKLWLWIGARSRNGSDFMKVSIDGKRLLKIRERARRFRAGYVPVTLDISEYADGEEHRIRFFSDTSGFGPLGAGSVTNFNIDDVSIRVE